MSVISLGNRLRLLDKSKIFSINLRRYRELKKLSMLKLSHMADVGISTIFRAESKKTIPHGKNIEKIAKALGVSEADLFNDPFSKTKTLANMTKEDLVQTIFESQKEGPANSEMTREELELLTLFRKAPEDLRPYVIQVVRLAIDNVKPAARNRA